MIINSVLKNDLKQEFFESLNTLKTVILERLLADNRKLRIKLSWLEDEVENLYKLEVAILGVNQHHRRNNAEITGIPLPVEENKLRDSNPNAIQNCG